MSSDHTSGPEKTKRTTPIDVHVGSRIRVRRTSLRVSQEQLAAEVGLTFQQIQKYERGANRVGSSRLFELARALDVPIGFFFDDLPETLSVTAQGSSIDGTGELKLSAQNRHLYQRETLELTHAYHRIADPKVRKAVLEFTKLVALGEADP